MVKRCFAFVACLLVLASLVVIPSFALPTEETQGNFLFENKNNEYTFAELKASDRFADYPVPDMILDLASGDWLNKPTAPSFPSGDAGYFTNPFLVANYVTLVYTDPITKQIYALPFGKVELSYSLEVVDEVGNKSYAGYHLLYSVWDGDVAVETYRFNYRVDLLDNPKFRNRWEVGDLTSSGYVDDGFRLYIFMGGSDTETVALPVYKNDIVQNSGIGVSYPYLIGSQYQEGYNNGLLEGQLIVGGKYYDDGYQAGLSADNQEAYDQGYNNAMQDVDSGAFGYNLLGNTLSAPIRALNSFVLVTTPSGFNITLGLVVGCTIALTLFIAFLKLFAGG